VKEPDRDVTGRSSAKEIIQAAERASHRSAAVVHEEMKRGLNSLATITSIAPLVGLFGTMWGIMNSFPGMGIDKATGLAVVTGRLSLACVSAALGLLTALQSLWCHRYLMIRHFYDALPIDPST
jgi:biopolymer transport protein ExbB/TolQ